MSRLNPGHHRLALRKAVRKALLCAADLLLGEVTVAMEEEQNRIKKKWCRDLIRNRHRHGASLVLLRELALDDVEEYRLCLRMTPEHFETLLEMVAPKIKKCDTMLRDALTPRIKLEITLNFLATGNNYRTLQHLFRVSKTAISNFLPEVCDAIYESLGNFIKFPSTEQEWRKQCVGFENVWNFPNCCGAVDGKHIFIVAPSGCGSEYFNHKGTNSVVLMAVVDSNYCFTYINVGSKGSESYGGIFQNCSLSYHLENGILPDGCYFVADDAFPLKPYLLKPYKHYRRSLTVHEKIFNYRLSRARRVVENAFGILVSRFRVFDKKVSLKLTTVNKLVFAACVLHNWLRISTPTTYMPPGSVDVEDIDTGNVIPSQWRSEIAQLRNLQGNCGKKANILANKIRDHLKDYFNNEGVVPWQYKYIN